MTDTDLANIGAHRNFSREGQGREPITGIWGSRSTERGIGALVRG